MNDEQTVILIESINMNPNLDASQKLELVAKTMMDCKQKKIGKIITDAIERKQYYPEGPLKAPKKRGRGRPRKTEISDNARKQIEIVKNNPRRDF